MSKHIDRKHNRSLLLYHIVCPAKYRRKVFTEEVERTLIETCEGISSRYEIYFVEIGVDKDHVHFLVQSVPVMSATEIVTTIKSITAREIQQQHPGVKEVLWGGSIWTSGYYVNTVGASGNEQTIQNYVQNQGQQYKRLQRKQLTLQLE